MAIVLHTKPKSFSYSVDPYDKEFVDGTICYRLLEGPDSVEYPYIQGIDSMEITNTGGMFRPSKHILNTKVFKFNANKRLGIHNISFFMNHLKFRLRNM